MPRVLKNSILSVEAIMLVTALVHIPHRQFLSTLASIANALAPSGWILISMKEGTGTYTDKLDRAFHLYTQTELEQLLKSLGFSIVESNLNTSALENGEGIVSLLVNRG